MDTTPTPARPQTNWPIAALAAALAAGCGWAYWPVLRDMYGRWVSDPQYSHGYLVPVFSLVLLYLRRDMLGGARFVVDWRGLVPLAVGAAGYVAGGMIYFDWLTAVSLLPAVAGLFLMFGGKPGLRWAWPAVVFLVFMIPLPHAVETALSHPLQRVATAASTRVLQAAGFPAFAEGNVIALEHGKLAVVEACNGLSMLLTFAAITTGMAMTINRPLLDRAVLVLCTVPIAVGANVARISANGAGVELWDPEMAHKVFHDMGGWLMMPLAIAAAWAVLWLLSRLFPEAAEEPDATGFGFARPAGRSPARS